MTDSSNREYFRNLFGDPEKFLDGTVPASGVEVIPSGGITSNDAQAALAELDAEKSAVGHVHSTSDITSLVEFIQDTVAAFLVQGSNVTLTYDDGANTLTIAATGGGGGVSDGDKGDIIVSASGTSWTIDAGVVSNSKAADMAANTIKGRITASTGSPEDLTAANVRSIINVANGATANSADATLLNRSNHTGSQASSTISDFNEAAQDAVGTILTDTADIDFNYDDATPAITASVKADAITHSKYQNISTNRILGRVTAASGDPEELTGTQATALLDTFTSSQKGLVPASGGGTSNFLRADGTFAVPSGGGGSLAVTRIEQNLGSSAVSRGTFTVTDGTVSASSKIFIKQAFAALTGKGSRADENEMDYLDVAAEAGSGQFTVYWQVQQLMVMRSPRQAGNSARSGVTALAPPQDDPQARATAFMVGKVRGNFKFDYFVAS